MDNINQPQTKKVAIKKFVLLLFLVLGFYLVLIYPLLGKIALIKLLIPPIVLIPVMILSFIWGLKNRFKIQEQKKSKIFLILGVLGIVIGGLQILTGKMGISVFSQIAIGILFIYKGLKR